jgi:hypothetical protein
MVAGYYSRDRGQRNQSGGHLEQQHIKIHFPAHLSRKIAKKG